MPQFIVFEGLDGSGTSTQLELISKYCKQHNISACITSEPTDNPIGKLIRKVLTGDWHPNAESLQMLFCADRSCHLAQVIEPALKHNQHVICDRYIFSTLAFGAIDLPLSWLKQLNFRFRKPDLIFFFDAPPLVCMQRIQTRGLPKEHFEKREVLEKVYKNYKKFIKNEPQAIVINALLTPEEVFTRILEVLKQSNFV